ncbi:glycoside hydrolase family 75 protein [Chlorobium phaeovibrioides]|uniref:glycoside hydrolase family 75 protein n=1 Tax=Chlorobium phaeovibrioides TaxID=1094 RepID=UPI0012306F8E|nr:glycoside hydrolase family 75 protein [Chlorobium phaeovibrioides]QEQ56984.1 hypothetical protein FNV82_04795 [Chlorobium phaeovibrioides]
MPAFFYGDVPLESAGIRLFFLGLFFGSLLFFSPEAGASTDAMHIRAWKKYRGTQLYALNESGAYCYVTGFMTIDADGAPDAYHPRDEGLDMLKHSGYPDKMWWKTVLVTDPADRQRPFVMPEGPYAGYYLSMTALKNMKKAKTDPLRYVDASKVPYIVFPVTFARKRDVGALGDFGVAVNLDTGMKSGFVVADIGPERHKLGEVSIALAELLGGKNVSPRTGPEKPLGRILYIVFPLSRHLYPWPQERGSIQSIADSLLSSAGGVERLMSPGIVK